MSAGGEEFQFSSTFIINQQRDKVLYGKVSRDFVDVLASFLTLPLGTIVRLLVRHFGGEAPVLGSLSYLYKGLENLDTSNFYFEAGKSLLLEPRSSFELHCQKLKLRIDDTAPINYYICHDHECKYPKFVSLYYSMICACGRPMILRVGVDDEIPSEGGAFITSHAQSFIVTDDLQILPYLPESELQILRDSGVDFVDGIQQRTMIFGHSKMMMLLAHLLVSKTPLTDTILKEGEMISSKLNKKCIPFEPQMGKHYSKSKSKKMSVTAFVQKSTNRILAVHAQEDFVCFLFGLLTIPLGKAEFLLDGNTCLGSMDNLYSSVPNLIGGKRLNTQDHSINSLLNPQLPPGYVSWFNQILPLTQQRSHTLFCSDHRFAEGYHYKMSTSHSIPDYHVVFSRTLVPVGMKPNDFLVTDDLVVTIATADSGISKLQRTGIPLNDIETYVLAVGMEEAVNILKASLITSSFALSNGLNQCLLGQQSKKINEREAKFSSYRRVFRC